MSNPEIEAVILAAGSSQRFGSDKRLQDISPNRTLLQSTMAVFQQVFDHVTGVLRPGDQFELTLRDSDKRVAARDAHLGQGHTLAAAAGQLTLPYAIIGLADMPWVQPATLRLIADQLMEADGPCIVRPSFRDTPGQPVGFSQHYFPQLRDMKGDQGARDLIRQERAHVILLAVNDPGVLADVDRPSDLNDHQDV